MIIVSCTHVFSQEVFTKEEIDYLRSYVQTRKLPNSLIKEIAETMRCHFVVKRIDENKDVNHQMYRDFKNERNEWSSNGAERCEVNVLKSRTGVYYFKTYLLLLFTSRTKRC